MAEAPPNPTPPSDTPPPAMAPATGDQSLLGAPATPPATPPAGDPPPAPAAEVEAFSKAEGKDAKLAAWEALSKEQRVEAWKGLPDEVKTELGLKDPARPTYEAFKAPEGVKLDEALTAQATELFADMGLSQDQAQKLVNFHAGQMQALAQANAKAYADLQTTWVNEIKADPEIGGTKLQSSLGLAANAIDRLGIPGLKEALDLTGAGNNPAVVRAFVAMGRMMSEDRFAAGNGAPAASPKNPAQVIYGDQPKQSADA